MFLQASREARRTELKAVYATSVQADAEALVRDYHAATQRLMPAGILGVLSIAVAIAVLVTFQWPERWWTDSAALVRIAIAVLIVVATWMVTGRLAAAPAKRFEAVESRASKDVVPRLLRTLRAGAKYKPDDSVDRDWIRRSALISGLREYTSRHLVRWKVGDLKRQIGQVITFAKERPSGDFEPNSYPFRGLVAIADRPNPIPGHVVVRSQQGTIGQGPPIVGLPPCSSDELDALGPWRVRDEYAVFASSPDALRAALTPDACALLNLLHPDSCVHVAFAHREVIVLLEQHAPWFERVSKGLDEAHFLELAEFMDVVDALAHR